MRCKAQVIFEHGPPECMSWTSWNLPRLQAGEVCLRHTAIGVNAADTYHRGGVAHPWPVPKCPVIIGFEGVGFVEAVGADVIDFQVGDRVAYAIPPLGSYSEFRNYPADKLLHLPENLEDRVVASLLMRGITAHYLLNRTYQVKSGDMILVHAAAGGMGLILCQWAKAIGAIVIGTVSNEIKAEAAFAAGCDFPIIRSRENFVDRVMQITNNEGVSVVYDGIGKETLLGSLDSLKPMGVCAAYGHVSGPPEPIDLINDLGKRGSLFLTRPAIMHYVKARSDLEKAANGLFVALEKKIISANIGNQYNLKDAAIAHKLLEEGKTIGSTILIP